LRIYFCLLSKPTSGTAMALVGLGLRHRLPVRSFRIRQKHLGKSNDCRVCGSGRRRSRRTLHGDFFDEFVPMRNGAVVIQSSSPTATESA
jgi:hypothetical protein